MDRLDHRDAHNSEPAMRSTGMELHRLVMAFAGTDLPSDRDFEKIHESCDITGEFKYLAIHAGERLHSVAGKFGIDCFYRDLWALDLFVREVNRFRAFIDKQVSKTPSLRLATTRRFVNDIEATHVIIDLIETQLGFKSTLLDWKRQQVNDLHLMVAAFAQNVDSALYLVGDKLQQHALEAVGALKYEIDFHRDETSPEIFQLQRHAFSVIIRSSKLRVPLIPSYFVLAEEITELSPIDHMSNAEQSFFRGTISPGVWKQNRSVVMKHIPNDSSMYSTRAFVKATNQWFHLKHPNVVKLSGVSHIASPMLIAWEDNVRTTFVHYFKESDDNRRRFWRLFHQASLGVQYLHHSGIRHGALRCCNIAVSSDDTAKICDFVEEEAVRTAYSLDRTIRWKAPECIIDKASNHSFEADVFALGMCIIEAWTGEPPFGLLCDDEIADLYSAHDMHPRPIGISDDVWAILQRLCAFEREDRATIDEVVELLHGLAEQEQCKHSGRESCETAVKVEMSLNTNPGVFKRIHGNKSMPNDFDVPSEELDGEETIFERTAFVA